MKKIITILSCALTLTFATSCEWFEFDNQDGWDASVEGRIVDQNGNPVQMEQGVSALSVIETGWDAQKPQSWLVKNNGTYKNTLVFAGNYIMRTTNANFVADDVNFELKKGANTIDFKVTPYVTITDVNPTYVNGKIQVTCKVKANFPEDKVNNIGSVILCVYPDRFVRQSANNCANDPGAVLKNVSPAGTETLTLTVDPTLTANAQEFQYNRPHYIRIAAVGAHYDIVPEHTEMKLFFNQALFEAYGSPEEYRQYFYYEAEVTVPAAYAPDGQFNSGGYYNYSAVYKLENGTFTEVTDW